MSDQVFKVRSPGKVILHGEHAVVYGKTALAMSVDLYTIFSVKLLKNSNCVRLMFDKFIDNVMNEWSTDRLSEIKLIEGKDTNKVLELNDSIIGKLPKPDDKTLSKDIINSCDAFLFLYIAISDCYLSSRRVPLEISVTSDLPVGAGLGSSSSYTVGLTAAIFKAFDLSPDPSLINEWAFQTDKIFHGRPSGIDNSICTFGGALMFRSGKIVEHLPKVQSLPVILVNTKVGRNTKAMVEKSRNKYNKFTEIVDNIMSAIDAISIRAWNMIKDNNGFQDFPELFEMNQCLLNSLGAGHPAIDKIVECSKKYGLSAKLTGAGGGGTVIVFNSLKDENAIEKFYRDLDELGFQYWSVSLGTSGVLLE